MDSRCIAGYMLILNVTTIVYQTEKQDDEGNVGIKAAGRSFSLHRDIVMFFFFFANFLLLAVQTQGWCGYADTECVKWKTYCAAKQWNDFWTNRKRFQTMIFDWKLYPQVLKAAQNILNLKAHGLNTTEFCVYETTLNNTVGWWEDWIIQKLFNRLPFNHIGSVAEYNKATTYACSLHGEWFDSRRTSGNHGDVKIVLCAYKVKGPEYCFPGRRYDLDKYPDTVQIAFKRQC